MTSDPRTSESTYTLGLNNCHPVFYKIQRAHVGYLVLISRAVQSVLFSNYEQLQLCYLKQHSHFFIHFRNNILPSNWSVATYGKNCNLILYMLAYSEENPALFNGNFFLINMSRIAALAFIQALLLKSMNEYEVLLSRNLSLKKV